jgi:hypothetical protein
VPVAPGGAVLGARRPAPHEWIESPGFDLAFFILAPLVTLPLVYGALYVSNAFALVGFVLAFAHYLSSFAFYFWDENQARNRERWLAFFAGPALIIATFCALVFFHVPFVIQVVLFFWNAVHVGRQSCGILSIYRHRAGVTDPGQKQAANAAILATNLWFCLWNIETHQEVEPVLAAISPRLPFLLWLAAGAVAVAAVGRAVLAFQRRAAAGRPPGLPEIGLFVGSLALFHPYLWIPDSGRATFAMLLPHYVQYLALIWLVHRRKFREAARSRAEVYLHRVSANNLGLVLALAASGLAFFAAKELLTRVGYLALFESAYLLLAFVHFYVDGLYWAFRDPHVRRSLGPYLMQGSPAAAGVR